MTQPRARRRQFVLSLAGIGFSWLASVGFGAVLASAWMYVIVPATTIGALGAGAAVARRSTAERQRASIKVSDLRRLRRLRD